MTTKFSRRQILKTGAVLTAGSIVGPQLIVKRPLPAYAQGETVKIGILHSLSGTMAISEVSIKDVCVMAAEEINAAGGVLGKQIEYVIEDGASDWPTFAEKAQKLIEVDQVAVIFGCWTSASRKAVLPVFERLDHMLWYPVQYEGNECSKNIFYTPAVPNQQTKQALSYMVENLGVNKIYLEASDYVYPRTANQIAKAQIEQLASEGVDVELVGENYQPLGAQDYATAVAKIVASGANGVLNTINGDSNVGFFKQYKAQGLTPDICPVMSSSLSEDDVRGIGAENVVGNYAVWNYFQSQDRPQNAKFVEAFRAKYGADRVTGDPIEKGYVGVNMWKLACEKAGTFDIPAVREACIGVEFDAPGGTHTMRPNHHTLKPVLVGKHLPDGQFEILDDLGYIEPQTWDPLIAGSNVCNWVENPEVGTVEIADYPADQFR
ncbi:MAG: urea ABC transporter substrate-binding protein [Synechococcaceae cyanobacterium SM2_3_1]|nr:urea ABC transporter substrate-binding protein [Synechococcaceae cyanobacterium SM2_3_1]